MGYGTNGFNSDGTLMNVGNMIGEKRSIRLLGREKGYDTGHAMAALLGLRSLTADEVRAEKMEAERLQQQQPQRGGRLRRYHNETSPEHHAASMPPLPAVDPKPSVSQQQHQQQGLQPHQQSRRQWQQQQQQQAQEEEAMREAQARAQAQVQQGGSQAFRVDMRIVTTKPIELHSGNSLPPGVVGVVCKVPGDLPGTVAEVDIPNGPLFDAWPGTIAPAAGGASPAASRNVGRPHQQPASRYGGAAALPERGTSPRRRSCGNCEMTSLASAKFCSHCGFPVR